MLDFNPPELKDKLKSAINEFNFVDGEVEEVEFKTILDEDSYHEYDNTITNSSEVVLFVGDEGASLSVDTFIKMYDEAEFIKINKAQSYACTKDEIFYLLDVSDYDAFMLLEHLKSIENPNVVQDKFANLYWKSEKKINSKTYEISVYQGFCIYHLLVTKSGKYDDYLPAYTEYDYFIRIKCSDGINMQDMDDLAVAFIFELQATLDIRLSFSNGREIIQEQYNFECEEKSHSIFPLLYGKGIKNLLELYNTAKITENVDYRILGFTKVIEYIAPSIAKEKLMNEVRLKLTSEEIFHPSTKFISDLGEIYFRNEHDRTKDSELIKLVITEIVEICEIWDEYPNFGKLKKAGKLEDMTEDSERKYLENLSDIIYCTRNEIAHAKANYEIKGNECPEKNKFEYAR